MRVTVGAAFVGLATAACGGDAPAPEDGSAVPINAETASPAPQAATAVQVTAAGEVSFTADGTPFVFDFLPADENRYLPLGSSVVAHPADGATARIQVTFMGIDLRALTLPGEFPPPVDTRTPATAMMMIGISYVDGEGVEWAGPVRLRIESFTDRTLVASFSEVRLPHVDKAFPEIVLSEGRVRATLD